MRIDSHQHFWTYSHDDYPWMDDDALRALRGDHLPPDLLCHLNNAGLDGSVVVQVRQTLEENRKSQYGQPPGNAYEPSDFQDGHENEQGFKKTKM